MSEFNEAPQPVEVRDPRESLAKRIAIVFGIASLLLALISSGLFANSSDGGDFGYDDYSNSLTADDSAVWDDTWAPAGFDVWSEDSNVAWKWSENSDFECGTYTCLEAQFISRDGCTSSFYAAVNWLDANANQNGAVIGYDNGSLPALYPMQIAKILFEDTSDSAKSGQVSEISCR